MQNCFEKENDKSEAETDSSTDRIILNVAGAATHLFTVAVVCCRGPSELQRRRNGNAIDKRRTSSRVRARAPSATLFSSSRFAAAPKTLQGDKEGISASLMVTSTTCASPPPSSGRSRSPHSKPQVTLTQAAAKTDTPALRHGRGHLLAHPPSIHPSSTFVLLLQNT